MTTYTVNNWGDKLDFNVWTHREVVKGSWVGVGERKWYTVARKVWDVIERCTARMTGCVWSPELYVIAERATAVVNKLKDENRVGYC